MAFYDIKIFIIFLVGSVLYVLWVSLFLKYRRELDNRRFAQASSNQSNVIQLILVCRKSSSIIAKSKSVGNGNVSKPCFLRSV